MKDGLSSNDSEDENYPVKDLITEVYSDLLKKGADSCQVAPPKKSFSTLNVQITKINF